MNSQSVGSLKSEQYFYSYSIKILKKSQEIAEQNGLNALKLINSVPKILPNKIDLYA